MTSVTQNRPVASADGRRWMVLPAMLALDLILGMVFAPAINTATAGYLAAHHSGPLAPATAATHGYTLASRCQPRCSDAA